MIPIQERIAEVLRRHERTGPPFINGQRDDRNLEECECDWIGQYGEFPGHVSAAVTDLLIDLAGTGQLLASIDAMHRGASGVAAVDGSTSK